MYLLHFIISILTAVAVAKPFNPALFQEIEVDRNNEQGTPTCHITITEMIPFGCTVFAAATTTTSMTDCGSCALTTTSKVNELFGLGPVCIGGRKTITATTTTATATACFTTA